MSIYRLNWPDLDAAIRPGLESVQAHQLDLAGHRALRLDRVSGDHPPDWADTLNEMTGLPFDQAVRSASALLLVDLGDASFAISFGHGRHLLDRYAWERDFGLRVALRTLSPRRVAEVTRTALDTGARLDLTCVPAGAGVREFGIEQHTDLVKHIGGHADSLDLGWTGGRGGRVRLDGRDALKIRLTPDPAGLVRDLRAIQAAAESEPVPDLAFMEGIRPLTGGSRLRTAEDALAARIAAPPDGGRTGDPVGVSLPVELLGAGVTGLTVLFQGRTEQVESVDLLLIRRLLAPVRLDQRYAALREATVLATVDGQTVPAETSLGQWLVADLTIDGERYVFQQGRFYVLTDSYRQALRKEVERLMAQPIGWTLPPWPVGMSERDYNEKEAGGRGFVCLDRGLVTSRVHPQGIEVCDLVSPDNQLICVKRAGRSAALSHLFGQAIVAAEAIVQGDETWSGLLDRLPEPRRAAMPRRPDFVFGIQLTKGELTPDSLFTFSQVTLHRAARHLERLGMEVAVVGIPTR
ncbi:DUF6119 family protein [Micromonospora zhanjiangensis]